MLLETEDSIIAQLKAVGFDNVSGWSGKTEELFDKPKRYPAFRVVIEGQKPTKDTIALQVPIVQEADTDITVMVFFRSLRDKGQGAYIFLDALRNGLNGFQPSYQLNVGTEEEPVLETRKLGRMIWMGIKLLYKETYEFCYAVNFKMQSMILSQFSENEVLVKEIKFIDGLETIIQEE